VRKILELHSPIVMAGLVPAIHVFMSAALAAAIRGSRASEKVVGARHKAEHDGL
jgi:hypothetical protein